MTVYATFSVHRRAAYAGRSAGCSPRARSRWPTARLARPRALSPAAARAPRPCPCFPGVLRVLGREGRVKQPAGLRELLLRVLRLCAPLPPSCVLQAAPCQRVWRRQSASSSLHGAALVAVVPWGAAAAALAAAPPWAALGLAAARLPWLLHAQQRQRRVRALFAFAAAAAAAIWPGFPVRSSAPFPLCPPVAPTLPVGSPPFLRPLRSSLSRCLRNGLRHAACRAAVGADCLNNQRHRSLHACTTCELQHGTPNTFFRTNSHTL